MNPEIINFLNNLIDKFPPEEQGTLDEETLSGNNNSKVFFNKKNLFL